MTAFGGQHSEDGHLQLEQLARVGALQQESWAEVDVEFVKQFVELYMRKDDLGLAQLERVMAADQGTGGGRLLAFYLALLLRLAHSDPDILSRPSVVHFLRQQISPLLPGTSDSVPEQGFQRDLVVAPLVYELLAQYSRLGGQPPFKIDLCTLAAGPLSSEATNLNVRKPLEQFAIARLQIADRLSGTEDEDHDDLVQMLLEAIVNAEIDFPLVEDSCARVLLQGLGRLGIGRLLERQHPSPWFPGPILRRAEKIARIGEDFAALVAVLVLCLKKSDCRQTNELDCFLSSRASEFSRSKVLLKLVEHFREQEDDPGLAHRAMGSLLNSGVSLDLSAPLLAKYRRITLLPKDLESAEDTDCGSGSTQFGTFLNQLFLFHHGKTKCAATKAVTLELFVNALLDDDPDLGGTVPSIISTAFAHCLGHTFCGRLLLSLGQNARFSWSRLFELYPHLAAQLWNDQIGPALAEQKARPSEAKQQKNEGLSVPDNGQLQYASDLETKESKDRKAAMGILETLGQALVVHLEDSESSQLFFALLRIAQQESPSFCGHAVLLLCRLFPARSMPHWITLSRRMLANWSDELSSDCDLLKEATRARIYLIETAVDQLRKWDGVEGGQNELLLGQVMGLLLESGLETGEADLLGGPEGQQLARTAVQLCSLLETRLGEDPCQKEKQCREKRELFEREVRDVRAGHGDEDRRQDMRAQMDELVTAMMRCGQEEGPGAGCPTKDCSDIF